MNVLTDECRELLREEARARDRFVVMVDLIGPDGREMNLRIEVDRESMRDVERFDRRHGLPMRHTLIDWCKSRYPENR